MRELFDAYDDADLEVLDEGAREERTRRQAFRILDNDDGSGELIHFDEG